MKKILLDGQDYRFTENKLPLLIHGVDKSGASLYTISVIADLFSQGHKILVLSGYPMAREEFKNQVGIYNTRALFYTKDQISIFQSQLKDLKDVGERVILLKNADLFDEEVFNEVSKNRNFIVSGDFSKCIFRDRILETTFSTKVFFSPLEGFSVPELKKYEGYLKSVDKEGITTLG